MLEIGNTNSPMAADPKFARKSILSDLEYPNPYIRLIAMYSISSPSKIGSHA